MAHPHGITGAGDDEFWRGNWLPQAYAPCILAGTSGSFTGNVHDDHRSPSSL
ncbi:MAG: hypothetical protein ACTSU9_09190 [Promethearchaeota archaeon]